MRDLEQNELSYVSGAGSEMSPRPPSAGTGQSPSAPSKGNNGFGNGGNDGVPGKSNFEDTNR